MKKSNWILMALLTLCVVLFFGCGNDDSKEPHGQDSEGVNYNEQASEGLAYILDGDSYIVTGIGTCEDANIVIPKTHDHKPVTSIAAVAFKDCNYLKSVMVPDNVTSIGIGAFSGCQGLTSITVPFVGASKDGTENTHFGYIFGASEPESSNSFIKILQGYYVPESLKTITVTGGTSIGDCAFYDCGRLTSITIPNGVTSIGRSAFSGCTELPSITIPNGVTEIGTDAFEKCSSLTSIAIPDSVTSIGSGAFSGCTELPSITIPNGVTEIGTDAFEKCSSLTSITIPDSVTSIGSSAFSGCTELPSITIPDSVTSIGYGAFWGCSNLTSITIPNSVTYIDSDVFTNCYSLSQVHISDIAAWCEIEFNNFSFLNRWTSNPLSTAELYLNGTVVTDLIIPDGVTNIKRWTFYDAFLTSITIPDSVTNIGEYAFCGCDSLTSITIPDSVTNIGEDAFSNCDGLTSIFCEATSKPKNWSSDWCEDSPAQVYWGNEWEYVDGVPTPK